jgi:hypothetical protein
MVLVSVVGQQLPQGDSGVGGALGNNAYAVAGNPEGRTYFLGAFMSQYEVDGANTVVSSTIFTDAGKSAAAVPVIRAVLLPHQELNFFFLQRLAASAQVINL